MDGYQFLVAPLVIVIIVGTLGLYFWMRTAAPRALQRIYADVAAVPATSDQLVEIRFHTYWGLLAFFVQQQHVVSLPLNQAEKLLKQLHHFNLKWGILAAGFIFIPLLSWMNYRAELRKVRRTSTKGFEVEPKETRK